MSSRRTERDVHKSLQLTLTESGRINDWQVADLLPHAAHLLPASTSQSPGKLIAVVSQPPPLKEQRKIIIKISPPTVEFSASTSGLSGGKQ